MPGPDEVNALRREIAERIRAGDEQGALPLLDRFLEVAPEGRRSFCLSFRGEIRLHLWQFQEARADLARALEPGGQSGGCPPAPGGQSGGCPPASAAAAPLKPERLARTHWSLAVALERLGDRAGARPHFLESSRIETGTARLPLEIDPAEFDRWAREDVDSIPAPIREQMGEIHIFVKAYADRPDTGKSRGDPLALGLFSGVPFRARARAAPAETTITIFQRPHELQGGDIEGIRELLWETIAHELGHFIGLDERQVRSLGL